MHLHSAALTLGALLAGTVASASSHGSPRLARRADDSATATPAAAAATKTQKAAQATVTAIATTANVQVKAAAQSALPLTQYTYAYSDIPYQCVLPPARVCATRRDADHLSCFAPLLSHRHLIRSLAPLARRVNPYKSTRGPQSGYNQCNSTTEGDDALCQTLSASRPPSLSLVCCLCQARLTFASLPTPQSPTISRTSASGAVT